MKRVVFILMLLECCFISNAQNVFSSYTPSGQLLYFYLSGTKAVMTYPPAEIGQAHWEGYAKPTGHVIIPDSVFYYGTKVPVIRIASYALANCGEITSIYISEGIRVIESEAFVFVDSLKSISFPASADTIGSYHVNVYRLDTITFRNPTPPAGAGNWMCRNGHGFPTEICIPCGSYDEYYGLVSHLNPPQNIWFEPGIPGYNVDVVSNYYERGSVSIREQRGNIVSCDSTCIISATPNDGYRFMYWSNGNTANPDTLHLVGDTTVTAIFSGVPDPELCMVSVEGGHNMLQWDDAGMCAAYRLYRESVVAGEYEIFAEIPLDSQNVYIDSTSRPQTRSYRYRISVVDADGVEGYLSPVHKTIHLTISQGVGGRWNLQWTPYECAEYSTYIIYRGTNAEDIEQIDIMPADGNTSYTDEESPSGDVYYQVGIVMSNPCSEAPSAVSAKSTSISRSNIATNSSVGVNSIEQEGINVYSRDGHIIVDGIYDEDVMVYDIFGRIVDDCSQEFPTGVYIVKIGNHPARKVVVVR